MSIDIPFGWRCGSNSGIMLFELLDDDITQKFVDIGWKVDGARRHSGGVSARRRGIDRFLGVRVETVGGLVRLVW